METLPGDRCMRMMHFQNCRLIEKVKFCSPWGFSIRAVSLHWAPKLRGVFGVETARGCSSGGQRYTKGAIRFGEDIWFLVFHIQKLRINGSLKRSVWIWTVKLWSGWRRYIPRQLRLCTLLYILSPVWTWAPRYSNRRCYWYCLKRRFGLIWQVLRVLRSLGLRFMLVRCIYS